MAKALSLHIGLNFVDPNAYNGWDGKLDGCINDANAMKRIADSQGFTSTTLIDSQATASTVTNKISDICRQLDNGDFFLLTYSGHGGQVIDNTGEEVDGQNETWVLWDRQFIDNEIYNLLSQFKTGVRIFVSSDSCHSATVIRAFLRQLKASKAGPSLNYATEFSNYINSGARSVMQSKMRTYETVAGTNLKPRTMPEEEAIKDYEKRKELYDAIRNLARSKDASKAAMCASVIYISGCQDNQFSYDGPVNGAFTTQLLNVWNNGAFNGTYLTFFSQIRDAVNNPAQIPNYMTLGTVPAAFENSKPYSIGASTSGSTSSTSTGTNSTTNPLPTAPGFPTMIGPNTVNRQSTAPAFQVNKGSNPYYYVELTTDNSLFTYNNPRRVFIQQGSANTNGNWFATWGERLTNPTYQIPEFAWNILKNASKIYYRIGSTSSPAGAWNDLKISFANDDYARAPFISLQDSMATGGNGSTNSGSVLSSFRINGSVGSGGTNQSEDVKTVQQLLNIINDADGGSATRPLEVDGSCGDNTISAIRRFQAKQEFSGTGLIKTNSSVLHMLLNKSGKEL